jgi:hypothetical protein
MPLPTLEALPVALLPVRIETHFAAAGAELWVRVFPDDIHVDTFEPELAPGEKAAGTAFVAAGQTLAAWRTLTQQFGHERAAWIRRALTVGPEPPSRPRLWTKAPQARVLPDQWVVLGYQGGQRVISFWGKPISSVLNVGPTPPPPNTPAAAVDEGMAWMVDFDKAVEAGMGMKVPLPPDARSGLDQLFVLGVKADKAASKARLTELLRDHTYTNGLSFVPDGTPTNNTAGGGSGYTSRPSPEESWTVETTDQLANAGAQAPGNLAARALGIDPSLFQVRHAVTDTTLAQRRRDMNIVLWPATGSYYVGQLIAPGLPDTIRSGARTHFVERVRAAGELPVVRVGRQPYGLLAATPLEYWPVPQGADVLAHIAAFLHRSRGLWAEAARNVPRLLQADLADVRSRIRTRAYQHYLRRVTAAGSALGDWLKAEQEMVAGIRTRAYFLYVERRGGPGDALGDWLKAEQERRAAIRPRAYQLYLERVGGTADALGDWLKAEREILAEPAAEVDPGVVLLNALSMQPLSLTFRLRSVLGQDYVGALWRFMRQRLDTTWTDTQRNLARQALVRLQRTWDTRVEKALHAELDFPWNGPLVDGRPGDSRPDVYLRWLAGTAGYRSVRDERLSPAVTLSAPRPLLYLLARHSLLQAYVEAAFGLTGVRLREEEVVEVDPDHYAETGQRLPWTPWDLLDAPYAGTSVGRHLDAATPGEIGEVKAALGRLAGLSTPLLRQLLSETLDLCSHRFDAWATSVATARLESVRQQTADIYVGGYGWLESVRPAVARTSKGYVHAPSPSHAAAAAVLASGHLAREQGAPSAFAVDLSSRRVRLALALLDGVRSGQGLSELLGYRFERGLQQRGAGASIKKLRDAMPAAVTKLTQVNQPADAIPPHSVVDGLGLQRRWVEAGRDPAKLSTAPWPPGLDVGAVAAELNALHDTVDALSDLMLAEAMHQVVQGNAPRAAAALEAMSGGGPLPDPQITRTPRTGIAVSHRVINLWPAATLPPIAPAGQEAPADIRANAEPWLAAWVARLLPSLTRVVCRGSYVDVQTGTVLASVPELRLAAVEPRVSALDVVFIAGDGGTGSELEQRIGYHLKRRRPAGVPLDAEVRLSTARSPQDGPDIVSLDALVEAAATVRNLLAAARTLDPPDLALPEVAAPFQVDAGELQTRVATARSRLDSAATRLAGARDAGNAEAMRTVMFSLAAFGLPGAIPVAPVEGSGAVEALRSQADLLIAEARRRLAAEGALVPPSTRTPEPPPTPQVLRDDALARMRELFGPTIRVLCRLSRTPAPATNPPTSLDLTFAAASTPAGAGDASAGTWFQRVAKVREGCGVLNDSLLNAEMLQAGEGVGSFRVGQLPHYPGEPWAAQAFPDPATPPRGRLSCVVRLPSGPIDPAQPFVGLLVDEWVEVVPSPAETTGLALHYDRPDTAAPQAILLAVPPPGRVFDVDSLAATLRQTLEFARARTADRDALAEGGARAGQPGGTGQFLPALYFALNLKGATVATDFQGGTGRGMP